MRDAVSQGAAQVLIPIFDMFRLPVRIACRAESVGFFAVFYFGTGVDSPVAIVNSLVPCSLDISNMRVHTRVCAGAAEHSCSPCVRVCLV